MKLSCFNPRIRTWKPDDDELHTAMNRLFKEIETPSSFATETNYTNPNSPPPQASSSHMVIHHASSFVPINLFSSSSNQHQGQGVISQLGLSGFILIGHHVSPMETNAAGSLT